MLRLVPYCAQRMMLKMMLWVVIQCNNHSAGHTGKICIGIVKAFVSCILFCSVFSPNSVYTIISDSELQWHFTVTIDVIFDVRVNKRLT